LSQMRDARTVAQMRGVDMDVVFKRINLKKFRTKIEKK